MTNMKPNIPLMKIILYKYRFCLIGSSMISSTRSFGIQTKSSLFGQTNDTVLPFPFVSQIDVHKEKE